MGCALGWDGPPGRREARGPCSSPGVIRAAAQGTGFRSTRSNRNAGPRRGSRSDHRQEVVGGCSEKLLGTSGSTRAGRKPEANTGAGAKARTRPEASTEQKAPWWQSTCPSDTGRPAFASVFRKALEAGGIFPEPFQERKLSLTHWLKSRPLEERDPEAPNQSPTLTTSAPKQARGHGAMMGDPPWWPSCEAHTDVIAPSLSLPR